MIALVPDFTLKSLYHEHNLPPEQAFLMDRKAMTVWGNKTRTARSMRTLENAIEIEVAGV